MYIHQTVKTHFRNRYNNCSAYFLAIKCYHVNFAENINSFSVLYYNTYSPILLYLYSPIPIPIPIVLCYYAHTTKLHILDILKDILY